MRDIKFRGKDILHKSWQYGSLAKDEPQKAYYIIDNEYGRGIDVDENTVGQYTGLKDKNEKEIYEGDIIHIPDDWEEYGWASGENYEIDFKDGRFRLKPKYKPNATGYDLENTNELEIIGNIYDNPDLLEKGVE